VRSLYDLFPSATFNYVEEEGPPHQKTFVYCVTVNNQEYIGEGKSKKEAKQNAAATALKAMGILSDTPLEIVDNGKGGGAGGAAKVEGVASGMFLVDRLVFI